jgi:hypothetical protein
VKEIMKILSTQFNVFYPSIQGIRRNFFDIEEKLKDHFQTPFNLIPVPDEAPVEIPRIVATSKHGFSQLSIGLNNAGLTTQYNENFSSNWSACRDYLEGKIENYLSVLGEICDGNLLYSGLVIQLELPFENDPVEVLTDRFLKIETNQELFDVETKLTFVLDNTFYVNITLSNYRNYEGVGIPDLPVPAYMNLNGRGIRVLIDINDKYGFNFQRGYLSSKEKQIHLFGLATKVLEEKLVEIMEKGEFVL